MAESATDRTYLSQFRFLQKIPYIEAPEQSDDDRCFICTEPYNMGSREWIPGGLHDFPVRLPCRHVVGIQCLARWILSPNFDNHCCLCRAKIVPEPDLELFLDDSMDFVRLTISFKMAFSDIVKDELLDAISVFLVSSPNLRASRIDKDRTMIFFEEFLDYFAREDGLEGFQPPQVMQRRLAGVEQAVGPGPVEPRPRRTSVLKRDLLSLVRLVLFTLLALLCVNLYRWTEIFVNSPGGIDVVVGSVTITKLGLISMITLGILESALLIALAQRIRG